MKTAAGVLLAIAAAVLVPAAGGQEPSYRVVDGTQVDARTYEGWRTWRALACERCHGNQQQGLVGPALVDSLKVLTRQQFEDTVLNGRIDKGMPNFGASELVRRNIDGLYGFLKGRADGAIKPGRLQALKEDGATETRLSKCTPSATPC